MATWTNTSKNTTTFTDVAYGSAALTWDQDNNTWDSSNGTWSQPGQGFTNITKNSTSFTTVTKH